nr:amidohydrolase family protein [uncultured Flavobacterium sp.]
MKSIMTSFFFMIAYCAMAQQTVLINNVQIFNGKDEKTITGNVLIVNNLISKISTTPIVTNKSAATTIIDGKGKFLMPGLIDAHWHTIMTANTLADLMEGESGYAFIKAGHEAGNTLLRGFTSVRDLGGPSFGLKKAIDDGTISGPRIWPSGSIISQTSGHGDFRTVNERPVSLGGNLHHSEAIGGATIADGKEAVLVAVRENLKRGASQIKLTAGGGVSSVFDPLDVSQFTLEELKAAVEAAEDWGTYVAVHAYTPRAVRKSIEAGVKCIDHGHLLDDETLKIIGEKQIWLSMQPLDSTTAPQANSEQKQKKYDVATGTERIYKSVKKYKLKLAWGTDLLFMPEANKKQTATIPMMQKWFTPFEVLKMITSDNGELLALSGKRSPYREGKLGVIEEGAYADMILIEGNPLKDLKLLADYEKNFVLIMKDGKIYKNRLSD